MFGIGPVELLILAVMAALVLGVPLVILIVVLLALRSKSRGGATADLRPPDEESEDTR